MDATCRTLLQSIAVLLLFSAVGVNAQDETSNRVPVADAGLPRYAATNPIQLDGTQSYDPDHLGPLNYLWAQVSGPSVTITDKYTATPTISGFIQTNEIQECEFELVVDDGEVTSPPETVKVVIVPDFGPTTLELENGPFDPDKPTIVYFGGGDCTIGYTNPAIGPRLRFLSEAWLNRANILWFPVGYGPDDNPQLTYYKYADMLIVYLSAVAPDYVQLIQTSGWSTGGQPAIDVGIRLNQIYQDARYAVNHVTLLDAVPYCRDYSESIQRYLAKGVAGEQCWVDSYVASVSEQNPYGPAISFPLFHNGILNVELGGYDDSELPWLARHYSGNDWFGDSLDNPMAMLFNRGIVAGAYFSVVGPGKNLQLASTPGEQTYRFRWRENAMEMADVKMFPGRLPEPVTLIGPVYTRDPNGAVLTCKESENAVGYELLFGSDPYRVMDYWVVSDGPTPPDGVVTELPYEETWWTVRVRDQYGSTIYADPMRIDSSELPLSARKMLIENSTINTVYVSIQSAIDAASDGDEIVVSPGPYAYRGNVNLMGKNIVLRSTDPDNSAVVASTIIQGTGQGTVVTFAGGEDADCVMAGFTITGGDAEHGGGICCIEGSVPTVTRCVITGNFARVGGGVYVGDSDPVFKNCTVSANRAAFLGGGIHCENSEATLKNCVLHGNTGALGGGISTVGDTPVLVNCIAHGNSPNQVLGGAIVLYSNVEGGFLGQGNIDVDPLFTDPANGDYHLRSQAGRWDEASESWVTDEVTSPCIDAGDPTASVGDEPEQNGGRINMGAYGGTTEASKSP